MAATEVDAVIVHLHARRHQQRRSDRAGYSRRRRRRPSGWRDGQTGACLRHGRSQAGRCRWMSASNGCPPTPSPRTPPARSARSSPTPNGGVRSPGSVGLRRSSRSMTPRHICRAAFDARGDTWLSDEEVRNVLGDFGLPLVAGVVAHTADEAAALAAAIGWPVVAKLSSSRIQHKSDIGAVRLNLRTKPVRQASPTSCTRRNRRARRDERIR